MIKRRISNSRRLWFGAMLYAAVVFSTAIIQAQSKIPVPGDPITIDSGKVAGMLLDSGVHAYLGIPFAAPPVGELRWHAPMPVKPWTEVYDASYTRAVCGQRQGGGGNSGNQSEDCLYLNIWLPPSAKAGARLPVMVWIHGGGFAGGSPSIPQYSGAEMAKKGIVYVGISYRVNVLGFLVLPELTKESGRNASGNWGMLDQVQALQWVQRNIAAFGGDPSNVTLIGESAGSESIHLLQASTLAKGLFQKASGWSGAITPPGNQMVQTLREAEAAGLKFQEALKVNNLAELRAVPWDKVIAAIGDLRVRRPVLDGFFLPALPVDIFKAGKQNDVPIYVSSTAKDKGGSDEFYEVKTLFDLQTIAKCAFAEYAEEFFKLFPASNDAEAVKQAQAVVAGNGFGITNRDWARTHSLTGKQPAYLAQFARVSPRPPGARGQFSVGAAHASDIPYWLGTYVYQTQNKWTDWDKELSAKMMDTLIAFAKTGNPSTDAVKIPRYDPKNEQRIVFGEATIWIEKMNTAQLEFLRAHPTSGSQQ
jgi:para-nitrobenzyl esterase